MLHSVYPNRRRCCIRVIPLTALKYFIFIVCILLFSCPFKNPLSQLPQIKTVHCVVNGGFGILWNLFFTQGWQKTSLCFNCNSSPLLKKNDKSLLAAIMLSFTSPLLLLCLFVFTLSYLNVSTGKSLWQNSVRNTIIHLWRL